MVKNIANPAVTAFATQSSVAALPVNMESYSRIGFLQIWMILPDLTKYTQSILLRILQGAA